MSAKKRPLVKLIVILSGVFVAGLLLVLMMAPKKPAVHKTVNTPSINDAASGDTPLETLKTLTAAVNKVKSQNQTLINKNQQLKKENAEQFTQLKQHLSSQLSQQVDNLKQHNAQAQHSLKQLLNQFENKRSSYPVDQSSTSSGLHWVSDAEHLTIASKKPEASAQTTSLLNPNGKKAKPKPVPYFTLPVNATLTGAIAMQPLIGRVPINGQVPDPYHFKVIIGAKNLAANGIDIPPAIQGIVASGTATGDMLGSCTRGSIDSMTFVFQDGTISTTQATATQPLGEIAASNGNPCIPGSFHTNAPKFLAGTTLFAAAEGYANALSQAQTASTTPTNGNPSISTIIGNSNTYAAGQAGSAAAQAAQQWWTDRAKSSFDFVFVPNVDPKTHQLLKLNININQQIEINYDPNGRKIAYEHLHQNVIATHLD